MMSKVVPTVFAAALCYLYIVTGLEIVPAMCVDNCTDMLDGDYQSCDGCTEFTVCVQGTLYKKACVGGYRWDDSYKTCMENSTTCEDTNQCVSTCTGRVNGDYQSCYGCNLYVTCWDGMMYDHRECPGNLLFNAQTQTCEWTSPTCS